MTHYVGHNEEKPHVKEAWTLRRNFWKALVKVMKCPNFKAVKMWVMSWMIFAYAYAYIFVCTVIFFAWFRDL